MHEVGFTQSRLGRILYARGINGLIIASHSREMGDELQLEWQNFSAVKIDYFPHQPLLHNDSNNQCNLIRLAMRKVLAAGYQRIGFVVHRGWDHAVDHNWTAGFLCEQQHLRVGNRVPAHIFPEYDPVDRWFQETNASVVTDLKPFEKWYKRYRPDVIISKAAYVLPLFEQLGIKVPNDVAFVNLFLEQVDGSEAGVRQNHGIVGGVAVEILAGQLQQNNFRLPAVPTTTFIEGTWFGGATCPALVPVNV